MVRIKSRYKPPGYRTAQLVLVPVIAALLALGGLFVACNPDKESSWNSPRPVPTEAPEIPRPAARAEIQVTTSPSRGTPGTSTGSPSSTSPRELRAPEPAAAPSTPSPRSTTPTSTGSGPTDLQEQQIFSARTEPVPESIQLTPCQRSAAACFESGGLGTLMDNLDGLSINRDTGRFCFSFQEGCERR